MVYRSEKLQDTDTGPYQTGYDTSKEEKNGMDASTETIWQPILASETQGNATGNLVLVLRDYQREIVDKIYADKKNKVVWLPTGAGKTEICCFIADREAKAGNGVLFVVERISLCNQASDRFKKYNIRHNIIRGYDTRLRNAPVTIASIQTIKSRKDTEYVKRILDDASIIIIDEAHIIHKSHEILFNLGKQIIGLSATPLRSGMKELYPGGIIYGPSYRSLIEAGHLIKCQYLCPVLEDVVTQLDNIPIDHTGDWQKKALSELMRMKAIIGEITETCKKFASDKKTIIFCHDIAHANDVATRLEEEGFKARSIHYHTELQERKEIFSEFSNGHIQFLCSVDMLSTGFDEPSIDCAIIAAPTLSKTKYIQRLGRVMRPFPGKDTALIVDAVGDCIRHGFIEDFMPEELKSQEERRPDKITKKDKAPVKICYSCKSLQSSKNQICDVCGESLIRKPKVIYLEGRISPQGTKTNKEDNTNRVRKFYLQALYYARTKGYKDGWAYYKTKEVFKSINDIPHKWKNLQLLEPDNSFYRMIFNARKIRKYRN